MKRSRESVFGEPEHNDNNAASKKKAVVDESVPMVIDLTPEQEQLNEIMAELPGLQEFTGYNDVTALSQWSVMSPRVFMRAIRWYSKQDPEHPLTTALMKFLCHNTAAEQGISITETFSGSRRLALLPWLNHFIDNRDVCTPFIKTMFTSPGYQPKAYNLIFSYAQNYADNETSVMHFSNFLMKAREKTNPAVFFTDNRLGNESVFKKLKNTFNRNCNVM